MCLCDGDINSSAAVTAHEGSQRGKAAREERRDGSGNEQTAKGWAENMSP